MLLSSASVRTRRLLGVGIAALLIGGVAAGVSGSAQAIVTPVFTVSPGSGGPGEQVTVSGTACSAVGGVVAHVFLYQGVKSVPSGVAPLTDRLLTGTLVVAGDGTWSTQITIPAEATAGPLTFLANCANSNSGESATPVFWYGEAGSFTLSDGTTTTEGPATTTTESPTTTADPATTTTAPSVPVTTAAPAAAAAAVAASPAFTG